MMPFPKKIHLVYGLFGDNKPMPGKWRENYDRWKKLHSDYEVKLWGLSESEQLIQEIHPSFLDIFRNYPHGVQRADAIRPFILYRYGGTYVDLDTNPNRKLDKLLGLYDLPDVEVVLAKSQQSNNPSNWMMVSKPSSRFWLDVINVMIERSGKKYITKHLQIYNSTGPVLIKNVFEKYNKIDNSRILLFESGLLSSGDVCSTVPKETNLEFVVDQHGMSWNGGDSVFFNKIYCAVKPLKNLSFYSWLILLLVLGVCIIILAYLLASCRSSSNTCSMRT